MSNDITLKEVYEDCIKLCSSRWPKHEWIQWSPDDSCFRDMNRNPHHYRLDILFTVLQRWEEPEEPTGPACPQCGEDADCIDTYGRWRYSCDYWKCGLSGPWCKTQKEARTVFEHMKCCEPEKAE